MLVQRSLEALQALVQDSAQRSVQALVQALLQGLMQTLLQDSVRAVLQVWSCAHQAWADTATSRRAQALPRGRESTQEPGAGLGTRPQGRNADHSLFVPPDDAVWCRTTRAVQEDEPMCAFVVAEPAAIPRQAVKAEPGDSPYPAALHSDIQLLPQQAGMAAILATAVVNSECRGDAGEGVPKGMPVLISVLIPSPGIHPFPLQRTSSHARTAGSGTGASATCKPT